MRYNEKELKALGRSGAHLDKEGKLLYKKSYSSKGQGAYKTRWFRLRGNLLFYFKPSETGGVPETDPKGVLVLERCKIQHEPFSDRNHVFSIAFQDDSAERKHYFSSTSQAQSEEWVNLLRKASYEQLRATLTILQAKLLKLTGREPMEAFNQNIMHVVKQTAEMIESSPELRMKAMGGERTSRRDSRRKGLSGEAASAPEAEINFCDIMDIHIDDVPYLDMPITPIRKHRPTDPF